MEGHQLFAKFHSFYCQENTQRSIHIVKGCMDEACGAVTLPNRRMGVSME